MKIDYDSFNDLEVKQEDRLLTISLNRPKALNAISRNLRQELEDVWAMVRGDTSVGAVLFRGNGRAFCAGGDAKEFDKNMGSETPAEHANRSLVGSRRLLTNMLDLEIPIVCAVQGFAMGIGSTLALCSDVVIAAEDAVFADSHVSMGLVAGDGGAVIWPQLMSINTAKYYLMTGERINGAEAVGLGVAQRAVPADQLDDQARALAEKLANGPTMAIKFTKLIVNKVLRDQANLMMDTSIALEVATFSSDDHAEAVRAFMEKRAPAFTGR